MYWFLSILGLLSFAFLIAGIVSSKSRWLNIKAGLIGLIGSFVGLVAVVLNSELSPATATPMAPCSGLHLVANGVAKDAVLASLKAPSTAKFVQDRAWQDKDCTFKFHGYVDSQNSFGAVLRSEYGGEILMSAQSLDGAVKNLTIK